MHRCYTEREIGKELLQVNLGLCVLAWIVTTQCCVIHVSCATVDDADAVNLTSSPDVERYKVVLNARPSLSYLGFYHLDETQPQTDNALQRSQYRYTNTKLVILIALVFFIIGTCLTIGICYIVYKSLYTRIFQRLSMPCQNYTPKHCVVSVPCSEHFRFRQGLIDQERRSSYDVETELNGQHLLVNYNSDYAYSYRNSRPLITRYKGIDQPFVVQFSGQVTHDGANIESNESDVTLTLPYGSIPRDHSRRVYVNVSLRGELFNLKPRLGDVQLSPVVEVVCQEVRRFQYPVKLKIPHRALFNNSSQWLVALAYTTVCTTQPHLGGNSCWRYLTQDDMPTTASNTFSAVRDDVQTKDVTFHFDTEFIYVSTYIPAAFSCIGRVVNGGLLRQRAVVYAGVDAEQVFSIVNDSNHGLQVSLRTYICDGFTDAQQMVQVVDREKYMNSKRISHHQSLAVFSNRAWSVKINSITGAPWRMTDNEQLSQTIPLTPRICCLATSTLAVFRLKYGNSDSVHTHTLQAHFSFQQSGHSGNEETTTDLITQPINIQELQSPISTDMHRNSETSARFEGLHQLQHSRHNSLNSNTQSRLDTLFNTNPQADNDRRRENSAAVPTYADDLVATDDECFNFVKTSAEALEEDASADFVAMFLSEDAYSDSGCLLSDEDNRAPRSLELMEPLGIKIPRFVRSTSLS